MAVPKKQTALSSISAATYYVLIGFDNLVVPMKQETLLSNSASA